jgi:phosphoglycolate phosphatase-like HAD superfamily hydrolase
MAGAIVFELDALLDLSGLAVERRRANWNGVRAKLGEVHPYELPDSSLPLLELPEWARVLGLKTGVLSNLPGPIAQSLVQRFEIDVDWTIDAAAGAAMSPQPEGLLAIADLLETAPDVLLAVGCTSSHFAAAAHAGAVSIGAGWAVDIDDAWRGSRPDVAVHTPVDAVEAMDDVATMRLLAEVLVGGDEPKLHNGSLIGIGPKDLACGRHFSTTDRRLASHQLTQLILDAKEGVTSAGRLGELIAAGAEAAKLPPIDLVASVPGSGDFDRFAAARQDTAARLAASAEDLVTMVQPCDNYTELNHDKRRNANHGRFRINRQLDGETVLLIDDVITSGSQSRTCRRELEAAGASEVWVLAAAASQAPVQRGCPRCDRGVMRRWYGRNGPLYVCTHPQCDYTEPWDG